MDLRELIDHVDDMTDPSSMDKILIRLEEIQEEDDEFMELLVDNLKYETITWQLPWYQQSNWLTRPLEHNDDHPDMYRTDTISKKENKQIQENWYYLIDDFDIPDKLICFARWKNKGKSKNPKVNPKERVRQYVTAYLARGLKRTLHQVFKHVLTFYGARKKGSYSPTEITIMEILFYHKPRQAVTYLATLLCREPRGIYKRLQQMYDGKPEKKRLKWTLELATKFLKLLMEYSGYSLEELKNKKIEKPVWLKIQEDLDQFYIYLQNFWYHSLHVQLFVKSDIKINKLRKNIFKILRSSSYEVWSDIRWKEVLKQFPDGFSHRFLYRICFTFVKDFPKFMRIPLQEVVDYGLHKVKAHRYRNRRLKTLIYNSEGNLEHVQYSKNKIPVNENYCD